MIPKQAMPTKQTRKSIEAELNASETERIALQLQEVARIFHDSACDHMLDICWTLMKRQELSH
jgi:hypothetical protein